MKLPRVLLVDDYPDLLVALRRLLHSSCEVVGSVSSGEEAIEAVTRLKPDVIVLDVTLPDTNGLEVCRRIKQAAPETLVVLMTAADDAELQATAFEVGASAFVPKHAAAGILAPTIQQLLAARPDLDS